MGRGDEAAWGPRAVAGAGPVPGEVRALDVAGVRRTYWWVPGPSPEAPLLVAFHGAGASGRGVARFSGLGRRAAGAGFALACPNGWNRFWDDGRHLRRVLQRDAEEDVAFLQALVAHLAAAGMTRPGPVFLAGVSNGSFYAERLARLGLLDVAGVALVGGPGTVASRRASPLPRQPAAVVIFAGTADPLVPYRGGPVGPLGRLLPGRGGESNPRRLPGVWGAAVGAEQAAADWAMANAAGEGAGAGEPEMQHLAAPAGDLAVDRLTWRGAGRDGGRASVQLYRVIGGGHTWPGCPQYLPPAVVGPVARGLDATGILLDVAAGVFGAQRAFG